MLLSYNDQVYRQIGIPCVMMSMYVDKLVSKLIWVALSFPWHFHKLHVSEDYMSFLQPAMVCCTYKKCTEQNICSVRNATYKGIIKIHDVGMIFVNPRLCLVTVIKILYQISRFEYLNKWFLM